CLLVQLERDPGDYPLETILVRDHLQDIARNRLPQISTATGATIDEVKEGIEIIRSLQPNPGASFSNEPTQVVRPDVFIEEDEGELVVTVTDGYLPRLRVSQHYRELLQASRKDPEVRDYLRKKIEGAEWLLSAIHQRKSTLQRVAEEVVAYQTEFFREGERALRPLKMQDIADKIGVNVSTVSRAISGKYFQAPGMVRELKSLFTGGTVKDDGSSESRGSVILRIKDLIADENPKKPLSDSKIVSLLAEDGIHISRRTVTKYREAEGIPSSRERRAY
ncbi:MAG: RNA polymerase factor sigma-54, partial [Planctomycetota bacterium]